MTNRILKITLVLVSILMTGMPAWADDLGVFGINVQGRGDVLRLQLETEIGVFSSATMDPDGKRIEIVLNRSDSAQVAELIGRLENHHPLLKGIKVLPGFGAQTRLSLELDKPVEVLDETVVALANEHSLWELVLGVRTGQPKVADAAPPFLSEIMLHSRNGKLDIALNGTPGLIAEVYFAENPKSRTPRLVVELPEVLKANLESAIKKMGSSSPLVTRATVKRLDNKDVLIFDFNEPVELVDSIGGVNNGQGEILMSIVPDSRPTETRNLAISGARAKALNSLGIDEVSGSLSLSVKGVAGARVEAYTLDRPPRLVLDFLGWKPEQIKDAIAKLKPNSRLIRGTRVESTPLGSARAIFDLSMNTSMLNRVAGEDQLVVSMRLPTNLPVSTAVANEGDTNASAPESVVASGNNKQFDLSSGKKIIIRPVSLSEKNAGGGSASIAQSGTEYGLMGFFEKALNNDAKYKTSKAEFEANSEALPQARAGYLPTATFDYQRSYVRQNILRAANATFPSGISSYPNLSHTLTITQPLMKVPAAIKISQAGLGMEQAKLNLVAAEQDLILRVSNAYLSMLASQDVLDMANAEREAMEQQLKLAKAKFADGLSTITQLRDVEARSSLAQSKEIEAENKVDDAKQGLKEIIGENVQSVHGFKGDFDGVTPQPAEIDPWIDAALEQNLTLQARGLATQIAALEVRRQNAGYLPTVNLVATMGNQDAKGSIYGTGQKTANSELGIKINIPLYEGGMTSSLVREAVARHGKAEQEQEQERRRTERLVRSAFLGVRASTKMIDALRIAVIAQQSALQAKLDGFRSGLFNTVVVLDAYRLFFSARRDYLQARYDYLVNRLKLKLSVGTLNRNDLEDLSKLID